MDYMGCPPETIFRPLEISNRPPPPGEKNLDKTLI